MHRNPTVTQNSLKFFCYVATAAFVYEWFPSFIWPMLASLPLLCYMGHGNPIAYVLGSGYSGFVSLSFNSTKMYYLWKHRDSSTSRLTGITHPSLVLCTHPSGVIYIKLLVVPCVCGSYTQSHIMLTQWTPRTLRLFRLELGTPTETHTTSAEFSLPSTSWMWRPWMSILSPTGLQLTHFISSSDSVLRLVLCSTQFCGTVNHHGIN